MEYQQRLAEATAYSASCKERHRKNPVIDPRQKFPAGTEVYIRPIYNQSKLHFDCDLITTIEGTYAQLYGGDDFSDYATAVASWYHECELMPTGGYGIESCRAMCKEYFGESWSEMEQKRNDAIDSCPLNKAFKECWEKAISEALWQIDKKC